MVDQRDTDNMKRIMQMMQGMSSEQEDGPTPHATAADLAASSAHAAYPATEFTDHYPIDNAVPRPRSIPSTVLSGDPSVQAMKTILERFQAVSNDSSASMIQESQFDPELRRALVTERTETGARIGQWEIRTNKENARTYYDVVHVQDGSVLASDLTLYEAALGLVDALNEGTAINAPFCMNLLNAERDYASAVEDAILFKHRLAQRSNIAKKHIYEARYDASKSRAVGAKKLVQRLTSDR